MIGAENFIQVKNIYMTEAKITTQLIKFLKANMDMSMAFEVKFIDLDKKKQYNYKGDRSLTKELRNLKLAGKKIVHKLSDASFCGTLFDGFILHGCPGYFFFFFYKARCPIRTRRFYMIECTQLEKEIKKGTKSLTEERASQIAERVLFLKK
jgi:hypothetical protein